MDRHSTAITRSEFFGFGKAFQFSLRLVKFTIRGSHIKLYDVFSIDLSGICDCHLYVPAVSGRLDLHILEIKCGIAKSESERIGHSFRGKCIEIPVAHIDAFLILGKVNVPDGVQRKFPVGQLTIV